MSKKKNQKYMRVAFLGRGKLGYFVLSNLLKLSNAIVPIIITCEHSLEVGKSVDVFKNLAKKHNILFYYTNNINKKRWFNILSRLNLDLVIAMNWVNTIDSKILKTSKNGFLNLHGGMLPRYRGNACGNWAILNEEKYYGITVHFMEGGKIDSGPIVLQKKYPIKSSTTIKELMSLNSEIGAEMVIKAVNLLSKGKVKIKKQNKSKALYCYPRLPRDGEINWQKSSEDIGRLIRATGRPYPGAYSFFNDVKDENKIKKMIIYKAHVEKNPIKFCAIPGHLLKLENGKKWSVVCGDYRLLVLDEISINDQKIKPVDFFKTIRQRFGLDVGQTLFNLQNRINKLLPLLKKRKNRRN